MLLKGRGLPQSQAARRAGALNKLAVLDTPEEQAFDDIVFHCVADCDTRSRLSVSSIMTGNGSRRA